MGSLEAEEALLKKKLEETDVLEERREIRKQLRELRNKKFEEEVKKVTANDYRPGRERTALTNGGDSALERIGRSRSIQKDEDEDTYGLSSIDNEDDLQAMLNDTPFTETDKRKKIRARLREIRNQKLGIGEPIVIKRHQHQEKTLPPSTDEGNKRKDVVDQKTSSRISYNGDGTERSGEDTVKTKSSVAVEPADSDVSRSRKADVKGSRQKNKDDQNAIPPYQISVDKNKKTREEAAYERDDRHKDKTPVVTKVLEEKTETFFEEEKVVEAVQNDQEDMPDNEDKLEEDLEEDDAPESCDDYVEDDEMQDGLKDNKSDNEIVECEARDVSADYEEERGEESVSIDDEDEDNKLEMQDDEDDFQESDSKQIEEDEYYDEEDDVGEDDAAGYRNDSGYLDEKPESGSHQTAVSVKELEEEQDQDGYEDDEADMDEEFSEDDERDNEEIPLEPNDKYEKDATDKSTTKRQSQQEYSDEYSEGYSDYTATDEGSSIGGRRFEDDQNLDEYETESRLSGNRGSNYSSKSSSLGRAQGPSYPSKIDKVFQEKEPGVKDGKDFKEKLKKTQEPFNQKKSKKGSDQVDFRTVLRASEKPKFFGDKPAQSAEQVDFRNLLQKKVNTRTLADKDVRAEQVDFRTVLKSGPVDKKQLATRKTSAAEQVDFRTVLKKEPSVKTRKASTDDKEIFRKIRAGSNSQSSIDSSVASNEIKDNERSFKAGRPSIDALKRSGSLDKAKHELNKKRTESIDDETGTGTRKAGRPSLDALKESGDLGKTREKTAKFEPESKTVFKKPSAPAPKQKAVTVIEEDDKMSENNERSKISQTAVETRISEPGESKGTQESRKQRREKKEKPEVTLEEKDHENDTDAKPRSRRSADREERARQRRSQNKDESSERPRGRRVIKVDEPAADEKVPNERMKTNDASLNSEPKKDSETAPPSQENEDRRSSLKSGDKRARNRRLRRDQNEVVKEVEAKIVSSKTESDVTDNKDEDAGNDDAAKTRNVERVSVRTNSNSRSSVQVILSTNRRSEKEKKSSEDNQADSDDDEIGMRRNRRRLQRKESTDDAPIRVSVKSEKKPELSTNNGENAISVKSVTTSKLPRDVDDDDDTQSKSASKVVEREEQKSTEEAKKSRQAKMADLDAKLAERRRQRAMEKRKKQEQAKNSRMAFKEKLESAAPTTNGSQSPALQRANSNMKKLLHWCQRLTDGYPNVSVTNFTTSWSDGLAFCALLHNFVPEKIPIDDLSTKTSRRNFELAFTAAADEGVPEFLEVDDMVNMKSPDPKSVITYLHAIYQTFVSDRR